MTLDQLLDLLRNIEEKLHSSEVQEYYTKQPVNVRDVFVSLRQEVTLVVSKLENAQLEKIAEKLEQLSPAIEKACGNLQKKIDVLDDATAILEILSTVVGLAARIAMFL